MESFERRTVFSHARFFLSCFMKYEDKSLFIKMDEGEGSVQTLNEGTRVKKRKERSVYRDKS